MFRESFPVAQPHKTRDQIPIPPLHRAVTHLLTALLSLSIPPPTSTADVPRVIEDLKTKKAWFEANQARVTAENKAKAEAEIRRLLGNSADVEVPSSGDVPPPNGGAEQPLRQRQVSR